MPEPGEMTITVTVVQTGKPDMLLKCSGKISTCATSRSAKSFFIDVF